MDTSEIEGEFRRRRFEQLEAAFLADPDHVDPSEVAIERATDGEEALKSLERFRTTHDLDAFRYEMDVWSKRAQWFGFKGPNGQMFLNQLVRDGDHGGQSHSSSRTVMAGH